MLTVIRRSQITPFHYETSGGRLTIRRYLNGAADVMVGEMEVSPGAGLARHRHAHPEVYLRLSDDNTAPAPPLTFRMGSQNVRLRVNDSVHIPSNVVHEIPPPSLDQCAVRVLYAFAARDITTDVDYDYALIEQHVPPGRVARPQLTRAALAPGPWSLLTRSDVLCYLLSGRITVNEQNEPLARGDGFWCRASTQNRLCAQRPSKIAMFWSRAGEAARAPVISRVP
ncbi:MAG: hypothetical protein K0U93_09085 [Gammaproteobacteria bacterium]|nr:hypothetical protein [Gammaproteobacteria bacterium]